ncbi:MAG: GAF domain-containing sensor histidine kinase, partial [Gemmatimonadota bacterium]|nr:GAF domain-containing sensor histidine kinase [Gemmatimonadota bacterium]
LYLTHGPEGQLAGATGVCKQWKAVDPTAGIGQVIERVVVTGRPEVLRDVGAVPWHAHPYTASLPVLQGNQVAGVLVMVGDARDPFAALDERFLLTLGRQVGAAMDNNDLYTRLASRTDELERLAARMVQQHEEERRHLSRELHDETAQVFSAVKLQLGLVKEHLDVKLAARMARVLELVDTGIQSIRNVTRNLRPSLLDDLGLMPALKALIQDFSDRTSLPVTFDPPPPDDEIRLSGEGELAVFRALQEGLANVVRHADASHVDVKVWVDSNTLHVSVEDDGRGIPQGATFETLERTGHMGLAGMRERIGGMGGRVSLSPSTFGGAKLSVEIPLDE